MASKKFKTYCRIIDYLEAVDPELAELARGTCADMSFGTKGKPGVTFLMPQDKDYRKKLADLAYSTKVEDANKACDMFNALIIRDVFKTPADWIAKKDDIPNSLLPSQHVEVDSASGSTIVFKSGAKATFDTGFQDSSRRSNLAVWKLTGELPVTTDKPAKHKYAKLQRGVKGGYAIPHDSAMMQNERFKIGLAVENAYALHRLSRDSGANMTNEDIYLKYTLSLVHHIMHVKHDNELMYNKVLPLLSFDKSDFYILVEPHKNPQNNTPYLIDNYIINEWWMTKTLNFSIHDMVNTIEKALTSGKTALVYTDRAQLFDKIMDLRQRITQIIDSGRRACVEDIARDYATLEHSNTIEGAGPVYPDALASYYAGEPGLKMVHDELRYFTYSEFKKLESRPFDIGRFHNIVNTIGDYLHASTLEERCISLHLLNKQTMKYQIAPTEKFNEIKIFVNSTMFMYIPMTKSEADNLKQKNSISRPDPNNITIFNVQKAIFAQHERLLNHASGAIAVNLAALLNNLDVSTLDPALQDALRKKLNM